MIERKNRTEIGWEKLDNTANLFPVIANERMTNVYRIAFTLSEKVIPEKLEEALQNILPWFDYMNVRMRTGMFWYYFERNLNGAPVVREENTFPCSPMEPRGNRNYLFRVTYFQCRINLEVFHVLADGMGGINFLRELTYEYLRLVHPELHDENEGFLSEQTSLNAEDGYLKNYRRPEKKSYRQVAAVHMTGERFLRGELGVIHGYLSVKALKVRCKELQVSINEYLAAVYVYAIYMETLHGMAGEKPIVICVPVNLRQLFGSVTTRNFFVMVSAAYVPEKDNEDFETILRKVSESLREQLKKESLEKLFSYNVSNQKKKALRIIPLFIKKFAIKFVYYTSAKATTTTITNLGNIGIEDTYRPFIKRMQALLSVSTGQNMKATVCSYGDELTITFTSILRDNSVQQRFFKKMVEDGLSVQIETNGLWSE